MDLRHTSAYFTGLPLGYAGAVMMDPPWLDVTWSARGRGKSVDKHYQPRDLDWIKSLPVAALCKPDCSLTLWHPQAMTDQALEVMKALGFKFKSRGTWAKQSKTGLRWQFGTGRIFRSAAEFFIVGTRGHPKVMSRSVRNLVVAPIREHSRKPDQIYADIEQLWQGPHVELFARFPRAGWLQWGDQLGEVKDVAAADANANADADPRRLRQGAAIARRALKLAGHRGVDARDGHAARWSGTAHVILRTVTIFDGLKPPKGRAARAQVTFSTSHIDHITTPTVNGSLQPAEVWEPVPGPAGKKPTLIASTLPDGQRSTLQMPIHQLLAWATGPAGALWADERGLVFARNAAGEIVGVGASVRGA